jgi:hypothetical protein
MRRLSRNSGGLNLLEPLTASLELNRNWFSFYLHEEFVSHLNLTHKIMGRHAQKFWSSAPKQYGFNLRGLFFFQPPMDYKKKRNIQHIALNRDNDVSTSETWNIW